jgi:1,4-dihydroxy-2-naphthoyl-CoA hydrolase
MPFADLLGLRVVEASEEQVVAELEVRPELCTGQGVMHGGAFMAFADSLGALGTMANLPAGAGTTTIESKTNFLGPAPVGSTIVGTATPVHRGRRTQVWQTRITSREGKLLALVTQTQLVL